MTSDTKGGPRFASIRSDSIVMEVHRQIREQLLSGALQPGAQLRESVLASQMGVSRSPVREALRLLEQTDLVRKTHNRSYEVSPLVDSDISELAALRLADETLAVRLVVQNQASLEPLTAVVEEMRAAHARGNANAVSEADGKFHSVLVDLAGLPRLSARYATLNDQIQFVLRVTGASVGQVGEGQVERHARLARLVAEAQARNDASFAVSAWEEHILLGMRAPRAVAQLAALEEARRTEAELRAQQT